MDRKERVKAVHDFIDMYGNNEANFNKLYQKLLDEYDIEVAFESDLQKNRYLNNLRQTIGKQAEVYISAKSRRPVKGAPLEFKDFVSNFRHDVTWALRK